ncbi:MAG: sugar phosphate isomerase/epimerase [Verrucomicrobia bacterium]|nr:sugar phosphate isomerase/epimerase [Verrucomicrobiota bacterium]
MKRMLPTLVTAMTATLLCAPVRAERHDAAAEKLGFKLAMQCWTYRMLTTFETLERCQKIGIKYLEIYPGQKMKTDSGAIVGPAMSDAEIADLLAKAKDCGVKIANFGVSPIPLDEAAMKKHFEWARKLGLEVLVTEVTPTAALDQMSQQTGIRIALHNHPNSWPADKVLAATKDLSKNCGACADTGHWLRAKKNPVENLKLLEGRVIESHFKDLDDKMSDVVYGTGVANVKAMMEELKRQGFKGTMVIEYEHGDLAHLDATIPQCVAAFDRLAAAVAKE